MRSLFQDLRYAARVLIKTPAFTLTAILTLAIGIGANTAVFSLVDAFMFRMLPVRDPHQLVIVESVGTDGRHAKLFSRETFERLRSFNRELSGLFAADELAVTISIGNQPEPGQASFVSGNYFEVLGVTATAGRIFSDADDRAGPNAIAVVSHDFWQQRLGSAGDAVGKVIHIGRVPVTVIGIAPDGFHGRTVAGKSADVILPLSLRSQLSLVDGGVELMGRLNAGATSATARADLDTIYQQALADDATSSRPQRNRTIEIRSGSRGTGVSSDVNTAILILQMVVATILLIACVNVSNLSLARSWSRQREMAVRLSLGASRARLVRQLLTESVLLALTGGTLALLVACWGVHILKGALSFQLLLPNSFHFELNLAVLAITFSVSAISGIVSGLAPALTATRVNIDLNLKGARSGRVANHKLANSFVIAQLALSLTLLIGAGLLLRTLRQLTAVETGFDRNNVLTAWVAPSAAGYDHPHELHFYGQVLEQLENIPGAQSASLTLSPIYQGAVFVGPNFFRTEGIRLLSGREFLATDKENGPKVAIISESLARNFFPSQNPLGQHFDFESGGGFNIKPGAGDIKIVGIASDIRTNLWNQDWLASFYLPYTQAPPKAFGQVELLIRTNSNPAQLIPAVRRAVNSIDPDLPLVDVRTQADEMNQKYLGAVRPVATLLTVFAVIALVLTVLGLYGLLSFVVLQRTREFGIRMALGAQAVDVLQLVVGHGMKLAAIGIGAGLLISFLLTRFIRAMLFDVSATDPLTFTALAVLLLLVSVLACYLPAKRATKVDPIEALRHE